MPPEALSSKQDRTLRIIREFRTAYPDAHCELNHSNPLELLIATILSAQCTDKRVNQVTPALFAKYPTAADYASAPSAELQKAIQSTGFFRNKTKSIKACCQSIIERHGGRVPDTMEELTALGGVGRKTANVVLGNAFRKNIGIVVDTHVARLSFRLDLSRQNNPVKIETDLMKLVPQNHWTLFSHLLIFHGRRRCLARNPDCPHCEVLSLCPRLGLKNPRPVPAVRASSSKEA